MNPHSCLRLTPLLLTLFLPRLAPSATIYSNLQDIPIPTTFGGIYLDVDAGTTGGSEFSGWDINPFFGGSGIGNSAAFQPVRTGSGNLDAVLNLASGTVISSSLTYSSGFGGSGSPNEHIGGGAGQFQVGTEGYLGFKFTKNDASGPHYGWMRVVLTNNTGGALIKDWGYDDAGGAIVIGRVAQSAPVSGAQTVTLSPATGESFTLGSVLSDTGGNVNSVVKTGAGTATLGAAGTYTGTTAVNGGTLLLGASGQLPDAAPLQLGGGTFGTGGYSDTTGALSLLSSSVIDMGAGSSVMTFAGLNPGNNWTGILSVWNWTGAMRTAGGVDQLKFASQIGNLSEAQLANVRFYSDGGATLIGGGGAVFVGDELVPVPEPGAAAAAALLLGAVAWRSRRAAEKREHLLTAENFRLMAEQLGNPAADPHGRPIPPA